MNTTATATKDLATGTRYITGGTTWEVTEIQKLATGNFEILATVVDGGPEGNTFYWYGTPNQTVEVVPTTLKMTSENAALPPASQERRTVTKVAEDGTRYAIYELVAPYADYSDDARIFTNCTRCGGDGLYKAPTFSGECFQCRGRGYHETQTLGEARTYWAKQAAEYQAEQDTPEAVNLARLLATQGITVNEDGTITGP